MHWASSHGERVKTRPVINLTTMGSRLLLPLTLALLLAAVPPSSAGAFLTEDTPYVAQSTWGVKSTVGIGEFALWGRSPWLEEPTGQDVRVAIIDTGIDASHPDLQDQPVLWKDFVGDAYGSGSPVPYDDNGHGTHVAGIVAAGGHATPNPLSPYAVTGMRGMAPDADLLVAKAMGQDGRGDDATVARAVAWAVDPNGDGNLEDGADVINLSLGIEQPRDTGPTAEPVVGSRTKAALQDAVSRGVVVVVSSGNQGLSHVSDPGNLDAVITVAAADRSGNVAEFSNHGRYLDVVAPGIIVSTYPTSLDVRDGRQDGYAGMAGTSMAAPVVTGLVALIMDANPGMGEKSTTRDMSSKVLAVQDLVRSYAEPNQEGGERSSFGMVNAYASLRAVDVGTSSPDLVAVAVLLVGAWLLVTLVRGIGGGLRNLLGGRRAGTSTRRGSFGPDHDGD